MNLEGMRDRLWKRSASARQQPIELGTYTYAFNLHAATAAPAWQNAVGVVCPYCRGEMGTLVQGQAKRIVWIGAEHADGSLEVITQPLPDTHVLLACPACRQVFTALRDDSYRRQFARSDTADRLE